MANSFENVRVDGNIIYIYRMKNQYCVSDFIRAMQKAIRYINRKNVEDKRIYVDCTDVVGRIFPDACVPISALIQEYRSLYSLEIYVTVKEHSYLEKICFAAPLNLNEDEILSACDPFDRIFIYEYKEGGSPQAAAINQTIVNKLSSTALCEEGVLKGLNWCVYEIMDNVLIHSTSKHGYIMAQYHNKTNRIAICIYDYGIGIRDSLIAGGVYSDDEISSIELALQEGVGDGQGQGNGLFGLSQIVSENGGRLAISTGESTLMFNNKEKTSWSNNPIIDENHKSTTVDFQLDLNKKTDIKKALKSIGDFDDFDIRIEDMKQENGDELVYKVAQNAKDLGTRPAGKAVRLDVLNTIIRTKQPITLDFSEIEIVGSSFIDEFIGVMYIELGSVRFNQLINIVNMNKDVVHLSNRAIAMRIKQAME
ncbi:MAG: DUF4325 domain-containing protein [Eubacterium sp.]|nr:DUF4325 domain-containing protein [Eubacterium sp.]